jgi:8-oxo-dGTP diphosphatase
VSQRPKSRVVSAEIAVSGEYLLTQRLPGAVLPLLWEFPGGRVREGETDAEALVRCVRDRIGVGVEVEERLLEVEHDYADRTVVLVVYRCHLDGQRPWPHKVNALAWVAPEDFADYPFPGADQRSIELLLSEG